MVEDRHAVLDLVLAGFICLAAAGYWFSERPSSKVLVPMAAAVAETQPAPKDPFNDEGFRLYSAADYPGAELQFRKAIGANPRKAVGYCNLGAALIAERRYDEAIAVLRTAIALEPSLALARDNLSWANQEKAKNGK